MSRVAYCVTIEVDPEVDEAWNRWHAEVHTSPCVDGWVRHVCRYEVESRSALESYLSGARSAERRRGHDARWGEQSRVSRQILFQLDSMPA